MRCGFGDHAGTTALVPKDTEGKRPFQVSCRTHIEGLPIFLTGPESPGAPVAKGRSVAEIRRAAASRAFHKGTKG